MGMRKRERMAKGMKMKKEKEKKEVRERDKSLKRGREMLGPYLSQRLMLSRQ